MEGKDPWLYRRHLIESSRVEYGPLTLGSVNRFKHHYLILKEISRFLGTRLKRKSHHYKFYGKVFKDVRLNPKCLHFNAKIRINTRR